MTSVVVGWVQDAAVGVRSFALAALGAFALGPLALGALTPCSVSAQPVVAHPARPARPVRVILTVTDAQSGVTLQARITIADQAPVATDAFGQAELRADTSGVVSIAVRAVGYHPYASALSLTNPDSVVRVPVRLEPLRIQHASRSTLESVHTIAQNVERDRFDQTVLNSTLVLGGQELSRVPALGERDVLRATAYLPGVSARNDFSASFNVRGGEADQNLVLLDGIPIYNPFHFGGMFGTFIDAAIGEIELSTGGFPAVRGGKLSSVLDVRSRHETTPGVHGSTDLSLIASSTRLAGLHDNGRVAWSVAGRRTYLDKLMQAMRGSNDFPYHFQDAQANMRVMLPRGGMLSATSYGGSDVLEGMPSVSSGTENGFTDNAVAFDWGNRVTGLTYTQPAGARGTLVQQLSRSSLHTTFAVPTEAISFAQQLSDTRLQGRWEFAGRTHDFTVGYEYSAQRSSYHERIPRTIDPTFPDAPASDGDTVITQRNGTGAVFFDDVWRLNDRVMLRPGLRVEHVGELGWQAASPRLAAKVRVTPAFALTASAGRFTQWTHAVRNEDLPLRLFDLWMTADRDVPVSSATHLVLGAEHWLSPTQFVRVETYRKQYADLVEPSSTVDPRVRPSLLRRYDGAAYGVDVYLRQLERAGFSGWLTYSFGSSYRERDGERYFTAFDRRHSGNLVLSYAPDDAWSFGVHAGASTGTPYTGWAGHMTRWAFDPVSKQWAPGSTRHDGDIVRGARNAERLPYYARIDVNIERRFELDWATLRPMLSIVNMSNRRNVMLFSLDESESPSRITSVAQLPFVPSLGMRLEF